MLSTTALAGAGFIVGAGEIRCRMDSGSWSSEGNISSLPVSLSKLPV